MSAVRTERRAESPVLRPVLALELVEALFGQLPDVAFALKDESLRYQSGNAAMLAICGVASRADLIGRTARDFFAEPSRYEARDRQVLRTQRPLKDRLERCSRLKGRPLWLLTSVWPVCGAGGAPIGVASVSRVLESAHRRQATYERLALILEHVHAHIASPVDVADLAQLVGISVSQLERDFIAVLGIPPRRYVTNVRFETALELLKTDDSIADVAHACGYSDQSAFTRRFRAAIGMSPREYRRARSVETADTSAFRRA
jgi:PAS domain S-box-containing protein